MTLRAVRNAPSTALDRAGPWKRLRCLDCGQHQGAQCGRRRYFFRQPPEPDPRGQNPQRWPRGDDRERNRQSRSGRKKQRVRDRPRMRQRQRAERRNTKQRVRPEIVERQREWHGVIVAGLADPSYLMAEQQPRQEHRVAEPQDRTQQDRVDGLDRVIGQEACRSAKLTAKRGPRQNVDGAGELRREPHHQDADKKRHARIGTNVLSRGFDETRAKASPRPACRSRPAIR